MIGKLLRRLFRIRPPIYVVIYDELEDGRADIPLTEEYYGYFSSPEEARELWDDMSAGQPKYGNVKLCRVVADWPTRTIEP